MRLRRRSSPAEDGFPGHGAAQLARRPGGGGKAETAHLFYENERDTLSMSLGQKPGLPLSAWLQGRRRSLEPEEVAGRANRQNLQSGAPNPAMQKPPALCALAAVMFAAGRVLRGSARVHILRLQMQFENAWAKADKGEEITKAVVSSFYTRQNLQEVILQQAHWFYFV